MAEGDQASADISGKKLLKSSDVSWTLREGVAPNIQTFDMSPADARAISAIGGPLTLTIKPVKGNAVVVQNLWCLNVQPGSGPFISKVTIADRRWFWTYAWIGPKYFNHRRAMGNKRILNNFDAAVDFQVTPDVEYAPWSLDKQRIPWVAKTMLYEVMKDVANAEASMPNGERFPIKIDLRIGENLRGLPIENLTIDATGDAAARQAIGYLPEAGITVDYDGTVVIFSRVGGDESDIVSKLMPEIRGKGHTDLVKNSMLRPREVHVLFTREVELRFDFIEQASRSSTVAEDTNLLRADNVIPITDYQLPVNGTILPQGTWITMDQAFENWEALPLRFATGFQQKIDHELAQKAFVPEMDLWAALQIAGRRNYASGQFLNWAGRIAALQAHYRRTFRLKRKWMDRIASLRAYRLATIDPQTGQRGPATAHGDYFLCHTQKTMLRQTSQGEFDYGTNVTAYPAGDPNDQGVASFNDSTQTSPAIVTILDKDQGIIHVDYVVDPNRVYEMILPSNMDVTTGNGELMPTADISQRKRPIGFNAVINAKKAPKLSSEFKLAIMLTAIPASPNNNQQLHRVVVTPNQVAGLLPPKQTNGLADAKGPIMEIRVGPNVEVARIRWLDSEAETITNIFGLKSDGTPFSVEGDQKAKDAFSKKVDALCLNIGKSGNTGASLNQIALAKAAALYASLTDRYEGSMTGYMNGGLHLNGWISEISHKLTADGLPVTELTFPSEIPQFSVASFLDPNTRALIFKLVSVEK